MSNFQNHRLKIFGAFVLLLLGAVYLFYLRTLSPESGNSQARSGPSENKSQALAATGVSRVDASHKRPGMPQGALPGERVLVFPNAQARIAFLAAAAEKGVAPIGLLEALNAVRMRESDMEGLDPGEGLLDFNYVVQTPDLPEARSPEGVDYAAFGADALKWMGADGSASDWGKGIVIAVLDGGIDPASAAGLRISGQINLLPGAGDSWSGHGTAIATLLAGDGAAVQGIVSGASVLDVRVLSNEGVGDGFTLAQGIVEAVNRGARVLSMSLGSVYDSPVLRAAVEYAQQRNVVIVAAAGNEFLNQLSYPAAYKGVISVGATDANGKVPDFSNRGESLSLVAPGVGVLTRWDSGNAQPFSGTSAAVPFVSGAVAGMLSEARNLSASQVLETLQRTANDAGATGQDPSYGAGTLNLQRLAERNQEGIVRMEMADHFLDTSNPIASSVSIVVSVQNRGTTALQNVVLQTAAGDKHFQGKMAVLQPGASFGIPVSIDSKGATGQSIVIQSLATSTTHGSNAPGMASVLRLNTP